MKKLTILILVFFSAVSIPLAYLVFQTYQNLEQEEMDELRYFSDTLFDKIEEELSYVIIREERRSIDEYIDNSDPSHQEQNGADRSRYPVNRFPKEPYILGYLQNNPDSSFQTPLASIVGGSSADHAELLENLKKVNDALNLKWPTVTKAEDKKQDRINVEDKEIDTFRYAEKYLRLSRFRNRDEKLRYEKSRAEYVQLNRILNIAKLDREIAIVRRQQEKKKKSDKNLLNDPINIKPSATRQTKNLTRESILQSYPADNATSDPADGMMLVKVEPMISVFVDDIYVFIFRRILFNDQTYRQGVVIKIQEFVDYLAEKYFADQPMACFTSLGLSVYDQEREIISVKTGATIEHTNLTLNHNFSAPFSFLSAKLTCDAIPRSSTRKILDVIILVIACVLLVGLFTIYKSTRAVVELSERKSCFVSSVTHELKTPLTTIRMYIEMLEQGIARDHDREQEYLRILGSESSRLSRLINNVLEFSKLEKKKRRLNIQEGSFEEVIDEVRDVMQAKLQQDGFVLNVDVQGGHPFKYDSEVMVQVMINLVENSMKFGAGSNVREIYIGVRPEGKQMKISVSDTGPGIPKNALKKVFDNFYRVDNELSRTTRGTGIGLALVKNFITSMGGSVSASNNKEVGCTITILLPL